MLLQLLFLSALSPSTKILYSVIAQDLSGEPACASACLSSAITAAGCAPNDQACQCGPAQTPIGISAAICLDASCPATELSAIESIGLALCAQYSNDLTITKASNPSSSRSGIGVETGPVTVTITNAPTVTSTTANGSTIAAGNPTTTSHNSLGSSAIAGVVIGVIAAVVGMGVLLRFAIFKPRGKSRSAGAADYKTPGWPELEGNEKSMPQELHGKHRISELGGDGESPVALEISSAEIYEMEEDEKKKIGNMWD
jgi:hypothetical protein